MMSKKSRQRKNFRNNLKNRSNDSSGDSSEMAGVALSAARRMSFPTNDPFMSMFDWLQKQDRNLFFITVLGDEECGTFSCDNWAWMTHFAGSICNSARPVVTVRRFEVGPNCLEGIPYKTITTALYQQGQWYGISEEAMKSAHTTDHKTGKRLPVEAGVLFADFCETYPESPAIPIPSA